MGLRGLEKHPAESRAVASPGLPHGMSLLLAGLSPARTSPPREKSESRQQAGGRKGRGAPGGRFGSFWKALRLHNSNGLKGAVKRGGRAGQQLPGE